MEEKTKLLEKSTELKQQTCTLVFVLSYALIYGFALQISSRAQPQYIYSYLKQHSSNGSAINNTGNGSIQSCSVESNEDTFQQQASSWTWYLQIAEYGVSIPIIILVGPLTDKIGRKPILIYNGFLVFLSYIFRTAIVYFSLFYFVIAVALSSLSGTFYTYDLVNYAIMADITSENKQRSFIMVMFDALLGLGITFSQIITGYLIQLTSYTYPFLITTAVLLFYVIYVFMTLKDPWQPTKQAVKISFIQFISQICSLYKKDNTKSVKLILLYFIVYIFYYFPFNSFVLIRTLYQVGPPFCWSSEHIGWYGAVEDIELFLIATLILKFAHICTNDEIMALLGLLSSVACLAFYGFSNTDLMIYGATAAGILRILPIPLIKAIVSKMVHPSKQGVFFSNISVITAACGVGGSTVFSNVYYQTRPIYKGLVFMVMAGFQCLGAVLFLVIMFRKSSDVHRDLLVEQPEIQKSNKSVLEGPCAPD